MSRINRRPVGLQEFLGNTSQGVNPGDLQQQVRPTLGMEPFLERDQIVQTFVNGTVTTAGNGAFLSVPVGEVWRPIQIGARMTGLTGNDDIRLSVSIFSPDNVEHTLNQSVDINQPIATSPLSRYSVGFYWPMPEFFPTDWIFGAQVQEINISAPSETISLTLRYVRMNA